MILIWVMLGSFCSSSMFLPIENAFSSYSVLYNNSVQSPSNYQTSFTVSYNQTISSPEIFLGFSGYGGSTPTITQIFKLSVQNSSQTSFDVLYEQGQFSEIKLFAFSYLVFSPNAYFQLDSYNFQTFTNISTQSGDRQQKYTFQIKSTETHTNITIIQSIIGIDILTAGGFNFSMETTLLNFSAYQLVIHSGHGTQIKRFTFMTLIITQERFPTKELQQFYFITSSILFNSAFQTQQLLYLDSMTFMMTILGIQHSASSTSTDFYWEVSNSNVSLVYPTQVLDKIQFQYFIIGRIICQQYWLTSCIRVCPSTYTSSPFDRICLPCANPCSECSTSQNSCTSCVDGYQLANDQCQEINQENSLFLLGLTVIIPVVVTVIVGYKLCKKKSRSRDEISFEEHPSIQL